MSQQLLGMLDILSHKLKLEALALGYALPLLGISGFYMPVVLALPMTSQYYLWLVRFTGV
jgi:hypothetical protein